MSNENIEYGGDVEPPSLAPWIVVREMYEAQRLRRLIVIVILILFGASYLLILALFVCKAWRVHGDLSERVLLYLAGITVAQTASILVLAVKFLFAPSKVPKHK